MSVGTLKAYYRRMIDRLMDQCNVPLRDKKAVGDEIHSGLKAYFGVGTTKGMSREDEWKYVQQCEVHLVREYGYSVDNNEELIL